MTVRDVDTNTPYNSYFKKEANWLYRIAAKNRSTPGGNLPDTDVDINRVAVERSSSDADAGTGVDVVTLVQFLEEPASLRVGPSTAAGDNAGRTGLALRWNKSQADAVPATPPDDPIDATDYRIEYSNTGPSDPGGYDWRPLGVGVNGTPVGAVLTPDTTDDTDTDATAASQTTTDNAEVEHPNATGTDQNPAEDLAAGQTRHYRVFALAGADDHIMSTPTDGRAGTTANPLKPERPTNLRAVADGHTSIKLTWTPPDATDPVRDGSEEGPSVIVGYYIQYLDDGASNWTHIKNKDGGNLITDAKGKPDTKYTHEDLVPGSSREYRMAAVNKISSSEQRSNWTELIEGSTVPIPLPNAVAGLVVEATGVSTVDLTWLAQAEQPQDAEVTEYVIEHSPDGAEGTFTMLASVTDMTDGDVHSIHVDTGLSPSTERHYRVYAKNARGLSDQVSNVAEATTLDADPPGAPTVTLGTVTDTEINLSWTRPASDGGSAITGWIVEKAYGGSFLDAERTNDDAFTDAETWWDGLGCPEMVMAVMDSGTADMDNPFCAMYADLGDTEEAEVERVFAVRYFVIDDAAANSYRHYNLLPETERMYRLAAVNGAGIGMWSNAITATTLAVDTTTLGEPSMVAATSSGGTITINWTPGANAASQVIVVVNTVDDTDFCLHVDTSGVLSEHECPNLTAGQIYVVLVIALDGQGDYELGNVETHTAN